MAGYPTVGVRELRQNLSVYLRRVLAGETLQVTDRRRAVALLTPLPERADPVARLQAEGRIARRSTRRLRDLPSPLRIPGVSISAVLEEERRDRI